MLQYDLNILAIQEHTPSNRELLEGASIERHCDKYGYFVTMLALQILIIDKQLKACQQETESFEELLFKCTVSRIQVEKNNKILLPKTLRIIAIKLIKAQEQLQMILTNALSLDDILYAFGDLQDTPDNSKRFHLGPCCIPKHPLGTVKTCENAHLTCSIYKYIDTLRLPIILQHGSKGGRFIEGMYTCLRGLEKITGISIVEDTGVHSN
jgi:hypothetical protein